MSTYKCIDCGKPIEEIDVKYGGHRCSKCDYKHFSRALGGYKPNKRTNDAFQKAASNVKDSKLIRGKIFRFYTFGDSKADLIKQAKYNYDLVHVIKTPAIMCRVDPKTAKYIVYVHGKK